ncbi:MAG: PmeII family type II restriction endonuclease [Caldilineales bacterium]|nr:PmeII family type II restriction endonuclease [Caldilineales bacterium]
MNNYILEEIKTFIENNIHTFHERRLSKLSSLRLEDVIKRKNPYLFRAKAQNTAHKLVEAILSAYLSSQEEGIFGDFLENLAIFVCQKVYGGRKSVAEGIDLEFEKDGIHYLVSIKSGPNWGNSRQIAKMREDFRRARKIKSSGIISPNIVAINGCCYGKEGKPDKGDYYKLCGQEFWEFISGDPEFYIKIIEPLGHKAKERNDEFWNEYSKVVNRFVRQFTEQYCAEDGTILWDRLVRFNSGRIGSNRDLS